MNFQGPRHRSHSDIARSGDIDLERATYVAHRGVPGAGDAHLGGTGRPGVGVARARLADAHVPFNVSDGPVATAGVAQFEARRTSHGAPDCAAGVKIDV